MTFKSLGLRAEVLRALEIQGYTTPTPIQRQAIPLVLEGHDVLAGAQTGTGKTAAFAAPILDLLTDAPPPRGSRRVPRCLVLVPTRELAAQVAESFVAYGAGLDVQTAVVFGGVNFGPQAEKLRRGVDVLVATPGRLLDHHEQRTVDLSRVEFLVLDEGDRMLDMGFIPAIRRIIKLLPEKRQSMMFSATYADEIRKLAETMLHNPKTVEVARRNTPAELVTHIVHPVAQAQKRELLARLIEDGDWRMVLVFTRTKHGANRLAKQLSTDGISAAAIHGNKSQAARTKALADFKAGKVRTLVATDVASRGLDIELLPHVVNYELPNVPEDYVHRIGRTGRAGSGGTAVSLVCIDERPYLHEIQKLLNCEIEVTTIDGFEHSLRGDVPPAPPMRGGRVGVGGRRSAGGGGRSGGPRGGGGRTMGRTSSAGATATASAKPATAPAARPSGWSYTRKMRGRR